MNKAIFVFFCLSSLCAEAQTNKEKYTGVYSWEKGTLPASGETRAKYDTFDIGVRFSLDSIWITYYRAPLAATYKEERVEKATLAGIWYIRSRSVCASGTPTNSLVRQYYTTTLDLKAADDSCTYIGLNMNNGDVFDGLLYTYVIVGDAKRRPKFDLIIDQRSWSFFRER